MQQLHIKKNTLICCIYRDGQVIVPSGQDCIMPGDTVVIILKDYKINNFDEILETVAGGVISSHCGPGTLGVLFVEE